MRAATRRSGTCGWPRPRWLRPTAGRRGFSLTSLGRAYLTAGRFEEAFDNCRGRARSHRQPHHPAPGHPHGGRGPHPPRSLRRGPGVDRHLREISTSSVQADIAEGKIRLALGSSRGARPLRPHRVRQFDDDGFEVGGHMFAVQRAEALEGLGRTSDAADVLLEVLVDQGVIDVHLAILVEACAGRAPPRRTGRRHTRPPMPPISWLRCSSSLPTRPTRSSKRASADERDPGGAGHGRHVGPWPTHRPGPHVVGPDARGRIRRQLPPGGHRHRPRIAGTAGPGGGHRGRRLRRHPGTRRLHDRLLERPASSARRSAPKRAPCAPNSWPRPSSTVGPDAATVAVELADPRVSIVIPCFNKAELTLGCLQSLQTTTDPPSTR
jgi:hypothetical protein